MAPPLLRYDIRFLTATAGYPGLANVLLGFLESHLSAMLYWVRVRLSLRGEESGRRDEGGVGRGKEDRKKNTAIDKSQFISSFPCLAELLLSNCP